MQKIKFEFIKNETIVDYAFMPAHRQKYSTRYKKFLKEIFYLLPKRKDGIIFCKSIGGNCTYELKTDNLKVIKI